MTPDDVLGVTAVFGGILILLAGGALWWITRDREDV